MKEFKSHQEIVLNPLKLISPKNDRLSKRKKKVSKTEISASPTTTQTLDHPVDS